METVSVSDISNRIKKIAVIMMNE